MEKYKTIDLFAGAGGLSYGFLQTGKFELVAAAEINEKAWATYKKNIADDVPGFVYIENVVNCDLDRVGNREDERIFQWLKQLPGKIREDDWREFEKALNLYLKDKDTSVFEMDELFAIYDSLMQMCIIWREKFKFFATEHPKSAKIKTKGTWAKKYYARCFALKKEQRTDVVTEEICYSAFSELMEKPMTK